MQLLNRIKGRRVLRTHIYALFSLIIQFKSDMNAESNGGLAVDEFYAFLHRRIFESFPLRLSRHGVRRIPGIR
jgi:hypothetical protein